MDLSSNTPTYNSDQKKSAYNSPFRLALSEGHQKVGQEGVASGRGELRTPWADTMSVMRPLPQDVANLGRLPLTSLHLPLAVLYIQKAKHKQSPIM